MRENKTQHFSTVLSFTVPGPPQPKQRPRRGKGGTFYTPAETRAYEHTLRMYALQAVREQRWPLATCDAVAVTLRAFFPDQRVRDLDNVAKCLDGANGIVWYDDVQIVELHVYRGIDQKNPRLEVTVEKVLDVAKPISHSPGACHETKR
jgi:Holliday junction resolvase RusA-like endonuclease